MSTINPDTKRQAFTLLADGTPARTVADTLGINRETVKKWRQRVIKSTGKAPAGVSLRSPLLDQGCKPTPEEERTYALISRMLFSLVEGRVNRALLEIKKDLEERQTYPPSTPAAIATPARVPVAPPPPPVPQIRPDGSWKGVTDFLGDLSSPEQVERGLKFAEKFFLRGRSVADLEREFRIGDNSKGNTGNRIIKHVLGAIRAGSIPLEQAPWIGHVDRLVKAACNDNEENEEAVVKELGLSCDAKSKAIDRYDMLVEEGLLS